MRPSTAAACVRTACVRPSASMFAGRSSKISAAHLGQRVLLQLAQLRQPRPSLVEVAVQQQLDACASSGSC